ncbi:MAG TPA: TetR/AcrR family transcriptional regulator [Mycobacterium sp.]
MVKQGRPRAEVLDAAILDAATELVIADGYVATSVDAIARRAGTTRQAVYRRHPSLPHILIAALSRRFGLDPAADTGSLRGDLLAVQHNQVEFFADPLVMRALPGLLDEAARDTALGAQLFEAFVTPRRESTARALERAVQRGDIPGGFDTEWICDLLTGPLLMRALMPTGPIDENLAQLTVNAVLDVLAAR